MDACLEGPASARVADKDYPRKAWGRAMSRFWDRWATNCRNTRAVLAVVFLSPILIWALATDQQLSSNKLLAFERETAIVTKFTRVDTSELHTKLGAGINVYQGYVELADGT